jgi:hypothetical protein
MEEFNIFWEKPIDIKLIRKSWEAAFKRSFPEGYWEWRFLNNPFDKNVKAAYVKCDGVLAAYYSVSPLEMRLPNGQLVKAGLMNMGFTHPDYQGKGYYIKINRLLHAKLKDEGYLCVFGFANQNSHYPYRKYLHWNDLSVTNDFCRSLIRFNELILEIPTSSTKIKKVDSTILEKASTLSACCEDLIHIPRVLKFLNWRILNNAVNNYEYYQVIKNDKIVAITIFKVYNNKSIDIMEFFYDSEIVKDKNDILIESLNYIQFHRKVDINIWSNLHSEEHLVLEKNGFMETKFSTYFGVIKFKGEAGLLKYKNWHYRFIDSDVY